MAKISSTVPESVRDSIERYQLGADDPYWDQATADRLLSNPDIWGGITELKRDDGRLAVSFFVEACRLGKSWDTMPKIPTSEAIDALRRIAKDASTLADHIDSSRESIRLAGGSIDLAYLTSIAYRKRRATGVITDLERNVLEDLATLVERAGPWRLPDMLELLRCVGLAINPGYLKRGLPHRPRKPNDPNARRTFICQNLFLFFKRREIAMPSELLAMIVNTIMDDREETLDSSHVNKLLENVRR